MNERINLDIALWREFTENMLVEPEAFFDDVQAYFHKHSIKDILSFFEEIERTYPTCILQDKLILLLFAGSLANSFYQQEDGEEEDRFSQKMQRIYEALLHKESSLSDMNKIALTRLVAKAYLVVKDFNNAVTHCESAIVLEEKIRGERSPQHRREIFLQLISTCLQIGGDAYSRPAPDLALQFYEKVIQTGENTLSSPMKDKLNQVFGMMSQANYGLGLIFYKKKNFIKSMDSFVSAISGAIQSLQTEMNSPPQQRMLLALIADILSCLVILLKSSPLEPIQKALLEQYFVVLEPILNGLENSKMSDHLKTQMIEVKFFLTDLPLAVSNNVFSKSIQVNTPVFQSLTQTESIFSRPVFGTQASSQVAHKISPPVFSPTSRVLSSQRVKKIEESVNTLANRLADFSEEELLSLKEKLVELIDSKLTGFHLAKENLVTINHIIN